jgi:hypothetical protein
MRPFPDTFLKDDRIPGGCTRSIYSVGNQTSRAEILINMEGDYFAASIQGQGETDYLPQLGKFFLAFPSTVFRVVLPRRRERRLFHRSVERLEILFCQKRFQRILYSL